VAAKTSAQRQPKPGQHVISAPAEAAPQQPVTEASPGAVVASPEPETPKSEAEQVETAPEAAKA